MTHEEAVRQWAETWPKLVGKAWLEPAFQRRLMKEPASVLAEHGVPAVKGLEVQVVPGHARTQVTRKGSNTTLVLGLPDKPKGFDDEDVSSLERASAPAMAKGCFCFCGGGQGDDRAGLGLYPEGLREAHRSSR